MIPNAKYCKASPNECMQVCLEQFMTSSESYDDTWRIILDKMGLSRAHLKCIQGYDLNSPNYVGNEQKHTTNATETEITDAYDLFAKLDQQLANNKYTQVGTTWGCSTLQFTMASQMVSFDWL